MIVKVTILLNRQEDPEGRLLGFFGYKPGQKLEKVYEMTSVFPVVGDFVIMEDIFEQFNISRPADYLQRSLSVGDVVLLTFPAENRAVPYSCASLGFEEIQ